MNTMMKLTAAALGALSIAGGVAVAQGTSTSSANDARSDTANYGTPPGAALKRDGSLSDPRSTTTLNAPAATDTTRTTTNTTTTAAAPYGTAPAAHSSAPVADTSMKPRADRN